MSQTPVRSGLPSGRRGTCPGFSPLASFQAAGATALLCAKAIIDKPKNAANVDVEIKYVRKCFFTWNPPRLGWTELNHFRVLLYHCEIHAFPVPDCLRRRRSFGTNERVSFLRVALQPQSGRVFDGPFGRPVHRLLSLRVRGLDQEESD